MTSPELMRVAAIGYERGFDIDRLLVDICAELARCAVRLGGLLQVSTGARGGNCATAVHALDLRTRQAFDIWRERGRCGSGCRLDEAGLSAAESVVRAAIADRVDLLIVNRFGRAESLGRGLLGSVAAAVEVGIPVLTAVRPPYDRAWRAFHGGAGQELAPDMASVLDWAAAAAGSPLEAGRSLARDLR